MATGPKRLFIATTTMGQESAAGAFASGASRAKVKCVGANDRKGLSSRNSAHNDCEGQSACKGEGFIETSGAKECTAKGGQLQAMNRRRFLAYRLTHSHRATRRVVVALRSLTDGVNGLRPVTNRILMCAELVSCSSLIPLYVAPFARPAHHDGSLQMIPILLHIGPITVYSYGFMVALSFIVGDRLLTSEFERCGHDPALASTLVLWVAVASFAGARVNDILDNWTAYTADPKTMIFSSTGFVFYGGFLGGLITSIIFARRFRIPWLTIVDMCAPVLALGHAIGRQGCQLSGDGDWGTPSNLPWAMAYPKAIVGWNAETVLRLDKRGNLLSGFYPGVRVHPTPIYESVLYLAVFVLLWRFRGRTWVEGRVAYLFLILYGASRFVVEFLRINPRVFFGLSEAQLISLAMIIWGSSALAVSRVAHPPATPSTS